jgi:superfamily II DNA or RNA helicase
MSEVSFSSDLDIEQLDEIEFHAIQSSKLPNPNANQRTLSLSNSGFSIGQSSHSTTQRPRIQSTKVWQPKRKRSRVKEQYEDEDNPSDPGESLEEEDYSIPLPYDPSLPLTHTSPPSTSSTYIFPRHRSFQSRDYQMNILKKCLFTNTLVSLPTGLGKTFIAAAVMLNFYRWFPTGLILFLAPTKPLVNQQISACLNIAGLPPSSCIVLTGSSPRTSRAQVYAQQREAPHDPRIVFATPQTVENDLRTGILEARQVVCLVVDEAHRATGGYAYVGVVERLMSGNGGKFRVLALTATPGNMFEKVQEVVDGLHVLYSPFSRLHEHQSSPFGCFPTYRLVISK